MQLKELFLKYGINLNKKTPVLNNERGLEIKQYLKEHTNIEQIIKRFGREKNKEHEYDDGR